MADPDLPTLVSLWELALRAERKSPPTIKSYSEGVRQYLRWCTQNDRPRVLDRHQLAGFIDSRLVAGLRPATARARQLGVRRCSSGLADEREIQADPLLGVKAPKLDTEVVEPLTSDQLKALVKACAGRDLRERRDEALVRLMIETGARAGEVVALQVTDLNLSEGAAIVRRGKGGKGRVLPFGPETALALDRYMRG